jgi:thiosulfate dehydrogenase
MLDKLARRKPPRTSVPGAAVSLLVLLVGGCSESAREYGHVLFDDASVSSAASNHFRCSTCHDTGPAPQTIHAGYDLHDTTVRPSYWGGFEPTLLDAINQCLTEFMRGRALAPTDERARGLYVYLQSVSTDATAPALPLTIVQNIVDVPSGEVDTGKQTYDQACAGCHGAPHTGVGRLSAEVSIVPDETLQQHGTDPTSGARPVVIEKVRHGRFFNIGGNMPLFSEEVLSDAQLGSILAYLETFGLPKSAGM